MSTLIGVVVVALLLVLWAGALTTAAILVAHLWRWARRTDTYEPASAEAPMGCGCVFRNVQYTCMQCGDKRCEEHRDTPHACSDTAVQKVSASQFDADGDLLTQSFESKLYELLARADAGEDITAGAPKEQT